MLVTSLSPRPRGPTSTDEPIIEALHAAVIRFADRLDRVSWVFANKAPIAVDPLDATWLKCWIHSHYTIAVKLPAFMPKVLECA